MIVTIDTCVLRRALEQERSIREDEETKIAYQLILKILSSKEVIIVANSETKKEYFKHLEHLKNEIRRRRIHPQSFTILRLLKLRLHTVEDVEHSFEFSGDPIGRKDIHLLNSAKQGALVFNESSAYVLTFANDVYRGRVAKNGEGVEIFLMNLLYGGALLTLLLDPL